jgi:hypothetical protein
MISVVSNSSRLSFGRKLFLGLVVPAGPLLGFMSAPAAQSRKAEIVLIDTAVSDYQTLCLCASMQQRLPQSIFLLGIQRNA